MKKILMVVIMVVCMFGFSRVLVNAFADHYVDESNYYYHSYRIEQGDTLWSLAEEYARNEDDLRDWIHTVERINNCSANIHYGDYIIICVPLEEN